MKNNNNYTLNTDSNMFDNEGNVILDTILSNNDEEDCVLNKSINVMNNAENVSGEEYIKFKDIVDKVRNEINLNEKEIGIYHNNNSARLKGPLCWMTGPDRSLLSSYYKDFDIENWYVIFYKYNQDTELTEEIDHEEEDYTLIIKEFLARKNNKDKNWARDLGHSLCLLEDYWGNVPAFRGKLKPLDFARAMSDVIHNVGTFLRKVQITPNLPTRSTDFGHDIKADDITDIEVNKFISEYCNYYKDNDPNHIPRGIIELVKKNLEENKEDK
tara:strand:- start:239 stop:1051 length:813 start_codon:yes stop_codon:yes gene_type:complete